MTLIHTGDNQCGLCLDVKAPCEMEARGVAVDMAECRIAIRHMGVIDTISRYVRFSCPEHPDGTSYYEWRAEVMAQGETPRASA